MNRMFLRVGALIALLAIGVTFALTADYIAQIIRVDAVFWSAVTASGLVIFGRQMREKFYDLMTYGTGHKKGDGHVQVSRDIGHLPGRSHRTFVWQVGHGIAASIGHLSVLRRARVGHGHLPA